MALSGGMILVNLDYLGALFKLRTTLNVLERHLIWICQLEVPELLAFTGIETTDDHHTILLAHCLQAFMSCLLPQNTKEDPISLHTCYCSHLVCISALNQQASFYGFVCANECLFLMWRKLYAGSSFSLQCAPSPQKHFQTHSLLLQMPPAISLARCQL